MDFGALKRDQRRDISLALAQAEEFEHTLFVHRLDRARLAAAGQPTDQTDASIAALEQAVATTLAEAAKLANAAP